MYSLDTETMLHILREHRQTGHLQAKIPTGKAGIQEPCRVEMVINTGAIVSCAISSTRSTHHLIGEHALRVLSHAGRLNWIFTSQSAHSPLIDHAVDIVSVKTYGVPHRLVEPQAAQLATWTFMQRKVFALIDGHKSIAQIAQMLSTSVQAVEQTCSELLAIHMIASKPQENTRSSSNTFERKERILR